MEKFACSGRWVGGNEVAPQAHRDCCECGISMYIHIYVCMYSYVYEKLVWAAYVCVCVLARAYSCVEAKLICKLSAYRKERKKCLKKLKVSHTCMYVYICIY